MRTARGAPPSSSGSRRGPPTCRTRSRGIDVDVVDVVAPPDVHLACGARRSASREGRDLHQAPRPVGRRGGRDAGCRGRRRHAALLRRERPVHPGGAGGEAARGFRPHRPRLPREGGTRGSANLTRRGSSIRTRVAAASSSTWPCTASSSAGTSPTRRSRACTPTPTRSAGRIGRPPRTPRCSRSGSRTACSGSARTAGAWPAPWTRASRSSAPKAAS